MDELEVADEEIEEAHLVGEPHHQMVPRRVEGDSQGLLGKLARLHARALEVVPHAHGPVGAAAGEERLARADVDAVDRAGVEPAAQRHEVFLAARPALGAQDVSVFERERRDLAIATCAVERVLRRRERERGDRVGAALGADARNLRGAGTRTVDGRASVRGESA